MTLCASHHQGSGFSVERQSNLVIAHVVVNDEFLLIIDEPTVK